MFTTHSCAGIASRRLILVDIENIIGGIAATKDCAMWGRTIVESLVGLAPHEHVIIGSDAEGFIHVKAAWESARVVVGRGPDAADLALLDVLHHEDVASRYSEILIVSGDHIFADTVRGFADAGIPITIASWRTCLSAQLVAAASSTIVLDDALATRSYVKAA